MRFALSFKRWTMIILATTLLTLSWITTALAQATDGDGPDGDEFSALGILVGVAAIAGVGWFAYRHRSTPHSR